MPRKKSPETAAPPAEALQAVEVAATEASEALVLVQGLAIQSVAERDFAAEVLEDVKARWKALETQRAALKAPILEAGRRLDAFFKKATEPLAAAERVLKDGILAFQRSQEQAAQAAMVAGAEAVPVVSLPAGFSQRIMWDVEVVDISLVPREYLAVDKTACLCAKLDRGIDEIPGVRFVQKGVLTVRT